MHGVANRKRKIKLMDSKEFFVQCLSQASEVVESISREDFDKPTPDDDWDVHHLLMHMTYELYWIPDMVQGKTIDEVGAKYDSDLTEGDFKQNWRDGAKKAEVAIRSADLYATAHLSFAEASNDSYINQVGGELLIHAWDLSKAIGQPISFKPELTEHLYSNTKPRADTLVRSGLFKPVVGVSDGADLQTKLLALFGRHSN